MTTIAYHKESNTVAWDSRSTLGSIIATDEAKKRHDVNDVSFWMCGDACDFKLFFDAYFGVKIELVPDCAAIVFDDGVFYHSGVYDNGILWRTELTHSLAIGSGQAFAMSTLKLGMSAKEAVEHAKTLDIYSGGEVHEFQPF